MPRGGRRDGAGRKAGVPSIKTVERRRLVERAAKEHRSPLDVMLENMVHFQKLAESAEAVITEYTADSLTDLSPEEQFKRLLAEVKKAAGFREMAHNCARDAANYIHPRLSAIHHDGNLRVTRADTLSDDELAGIAAASGHRADPAAVDPQKLN